MCYMKLTYKYRELMLKIKAFLWEKQKHALKLFLSPSPQPAQTSDALEYGESPTGDAEKERRERAEGTRGAADAGPFPVTALRGPRQETQLLRAPASCPVKPGHYSLPAVNTVRWCAISTQHRVWHTATLGERQLLCNKDQKMCGKD